MCYESIFGLASLFWHLFISLPFHTFAGHPGQIRRRIPPFHGIDHFNGHVKIFPSRLFGLVEIGRIPEAKIKTCFRARAGLCLAPL
jgi:hypothetical protein